MFKYILQNKKLLYAISYESLDGVMPLYKYILINNNKISKKEYENIIKFAYHYNEDEELSDELKKMIDESWKSIYHIFKFLGILKFHNSKRVEITNELIKI